MTPPSGTRGRRANERIRQVVASTIERDLTDPRLEFVTVTDVRVSRDLAHAEVFFTVLDRRRRAHAEAALNSARGAIQAALGRDLTTRNTPQLKFTFDRHQREARDLTTLIDSVTRDLPPVDAP